MSTASFWPSCLEAFRRELTPQQFNTWIRPLRLEHAGDGLVLIAPSNPSISIGPILRVPGMHALLAAARSRTVAISPLIAGRAVKGPTVELMRAQGVRPDALGVAGLYREIAAGFVMDTADAVLAPSIAELGYRIAVRPTALDDGDSARQVAAAAMDLLRQPAAA